MDDHPQIRDQLTFAMAVINLSVEELIQAGFKLPDIIEALESYTQAAKIAEQAQRGTMQ